jgi:SAM-dependent methyltransferase
MTPREVAASYNKLAAHWSGDQFNRENGLEQHRRALNFLVQKGQAIDVGCGSSGRIIELMLSEGFTTEGLDISPEMLLLAKEKHPDVEFHQADICEWEFSTKYDMISAWDSIWHAPIESHEQVLRKLCGALKEEGVLIFTSGGLDRPDEVTNPCMGQPLYHSTLGIPKTLQILSECDCVCQHLEYDQYPEKHVYFIAQKLSRVGKS